LLEHLSSLREFGFVLLVSSILLQEKVLREIQTESKRSAQHVHPAGWHTVRAATLEETRLIGEQIILFEGINKPKKK